MMQIVPFHTKYAPAFYELNIEWLETFFYVEPYDREVLSNPMKHIIEPGGHIFFVIEKEQVLGTVALLKRAENSFELTKMAVLPAARGKRIGQKLMEYCIAFARTSNFERLYLYSHRKLANAIHIYKKYGFAEIELESPNPYERSNIKMEYQF